MRVVIALGGNAIAKRGESLEAGLQEARIREAVSVIAGIAREHEVVVTHGNGPQIGLLELQAHAYEDVAPYPLDLLGAETEGLLGYLLERELHSVLPNRPVATLLTQVEVDPDDPAFANPTKPIGPGLHPARAEALGRELGWRFVRDGDALRRVVPSPEPRRILELATIELLVGAGVCVVCGGGGGIPVVRTPAGGLRGVDAVVDKDLTAALLAAGLGADVLLLLTDVDAIYRDWPQPARAPLRRITPEALRGLDLEPGTMGPKAEAARRFAEAGGIAGIGAWNEAERVLAGLAGTRIEREG